MDFLQGEKERSFKLLEQAHGELEALVMSLHRRGIDLIVMRHMGNDDDVYTLKTRGRLSGSTYAIQLHVLAPNRKSMIERGRS